MVLLFCEVNKGVVQVLEALFKRKLQTPETTWMKGREQKCLVDKMYNVRRIVQCF